MPTKLVKVCGLKTAESAQLAVDNGAAMLGMILVPNRARTIDLATAIDIVEICARERKQRGSKFQTSAELFQYVKGLDVQGPEWFESVAECIIENGPFAVGVFRNQSIEDVQRIAEGINLDIVQLHGSEDVNEYTKNIMVPVIPRFVLNKPNIKEALTTHRFLIPLLDSEAGGEGKLINWDDAAQFGKESEGRFILAGGLTPENVTSALAVEGCLGVDVSGGVETEGVKDHDKIAKFVTNARNYV